MQKLKSGDMVIVISWKFKGKTAKIESLTIDKVYLDGVNVVKKATKGKGYVEKILPLPISNVMYYHEATKTPTRIKVVADKSWNNQRVTVKGDHVITK